MVFNIDMETILILLLVFILVIYCWNDWIYPFITGKTSLETFTNTSTSLITSTTGNNLKSIAFDSTWYLRDPNQPIILNNQISLPVIQFGFYDNGSYDDLIGKYFRNHIYPIEPQQLTTGLDTIYKFMNGDIDIAFMNEEMLARFIKRDCKYLTRYITDQLGLESFDTSKSENIERIYPDCNLSAIGVAYHVDMYLIVNNFSNVQEFSDIQNKSIGVLEDSYYYFMKLANAYDITLPSNNTNQQGVSFQIDRQLRMENLIDNLKKNKYDGIFILAHPKNQQLLKLTLDIKVRFIHIQKRSSPKDARSNLANLLTEQQGTNNKAPPPPPDMNRQSQYSKSLIKDLQTVNIQESFNSLIKKYFQHLEPRSVNLNKFHTTGNMYSYLETYSIRMILVIRNDIPKERVEYITHNYIDSLNKIRDRIDRELFTPQLDNFSSMEFNYNELLAFDSIIPLATGAREIYKSEGIIYYEDDARCRV